MIANAKRCGVCNEYAVAPDATRCDSCWELQSRINSSPEIAVKVLRGLGYVVSDRNPEVLMAPTAHVDQAGRAYGVHPEAVAGNRARAEQLARAARYGALDPAVDAINELLCSLEATTRERDVYLGLLDLKMAAASLGGTDGNS